MRLCIAGPVLAVYLLIVLAAMYFENQLIFFPCPHPIGDWRPRGLTFEDARFQAADGTQLHGWYVPCQNARAAVLFCHGNAGNITHRADILKLLHGRVGASVLAFDYRGYGRSEGKPNESGILADARAAPMAGPAREHRRMRRRVDGRVDRRGGGGRSGRPRRRPRLVLESTFDSLPSVAAYHYPWLPVRWAMRSRFDSAGKIGDYHGPLLQSHGDADTIVPLPYGRRLFEAANEPKQFIQLSGHDHNDPMPLDYYDRLRAFLEAIKKPR